VLQKYDTLGPTARLCLQWSESEVSEYLLERNASIMNMNNLKTVNAVFEKLLSDGLSLSLDSLSHKICLIRRSEQKNVKNPHFTTTPISDSVTGMLALRLEKLSEDELLEMWDKFSNFPDARGMLGSVFEAFVHRKYRKEIKFKANPMCRGSRSNSRWYASFDPKKPANATSSMEPIPLTIITSHITFVYQKDAKLKVKADTYYIPRSGQQVGLDSFIVYCGVLFIFQCTGSKSHEIKDGIIAFLQQ
jgi:hypothetical protein